MKRFILLNIVLLFAVSFTVAQKKNPDKNDFMIQSRAAVVNGSLAGPATYEVLFWDALAYPNPVDYSCSGVDAEFLYVFVSEPSVLTYYDVYEIYTPTGENLIATLESGDFDTQLFLYCSPFNPANPFDGAMFGDDDDGSGFNSAFMPGDNVLLQPNTSYYLVVTSFWIEQSGDYTLTLDGNVVLGSPPPPVPLSNWALYLGIFLMVMFTAIRFRRMV